MTSTALLIGIEYLNTANELTGCRPDVFKTKDLLINTLHVSSNNISYLLENPFKYETQYLIPTQKNIITSLKQKIDYCNQHNIDRFTFIIVDMVIKYMTIIKMN